MKPHNLARRPTVTLAKTTCLLLLLYTLYLDSRLSAVLSFLSRGVDVMI